MSWILGCIPTLIALEAVESPWKQQNVVTRG